MTVKRPDTVTTPSRSGEQGWRALFEEAVADHEAGRDGQAIAKLGTALRRAPGEAGIYRQLGSILHAKERYEAALACFRRAAERRPRAAVEHSNVGVALRDLGRFDEAAEAFGRAVALAPKNGKYSYRWGYALLKAMRASEAIAPLERAVALDPDNNDAALSLALAVLTSGDLARGWPLYEARWKHETSMQEPFPDRRWDGTPLDGTLLVSSEQGLGDAIQFIRYAALARRRCCRLVVKCRSGSGELLASAPGVDQVIEPRQALPNFEAVIPLLSLPGVFGTTLETIPAPRHYLSVDPRRRERAAALVQPLGRLKKIGIVWAGNARHVEDRRRSIPFVHFLELLQVPQVALLSLQKGERLKEATGDGIGPLLSDMTRHMETLADTAAIIEQLDLVITCDTSVAHLAGALGKPVWILLAHTADWRWMTEREDSPWYPSARLFRQTRPGDWEEVFRRVVIALSKLR